MPPSGNSVTASGWQGDRDGPRGGFAVLYALGQDAKRQDLGVCQGFIAARAVGQHARQLGNLGEPAAVRLAFGLDM